MALVEHRSKIANMLEDVVAYYHVEGVTPEWKSLADPATTLVVYMGRTNVQRIATELIAAGLDPATPAAAINKGTTPEQRVLLATLQTIAATIERADLSGPTLMIIGKVASLTETLAWFAPAAAVEAEARS